MEKQQGIDWIPTNMETGESLAPRTTRGLMPQEVAPIQQPTQQPAGEYFKPEKISQPFEPAIIARDLFEDPSFMEQYRKMSDPNMRNELIFGKIENPKVDAQDISTEIFDKYDEMEATGSVIIDDLAGLNLQEQKRMLRERARAQMEEEAQQNIDKAKEVVEIYNEETKKGPIDETY